MLTSAGAADVFLAKFAAGPILVSCPDQSLQAAIDAAGPGQTIIASGTCSENLLVRNEKQRITVDGGGTAFQRKVWAALREIPAGATKSYSDLAAAVGRPNAVRAVGMINGRNPISIVVPCHRVIGKDGSLTGYGGGLDRKRWLLQHEGALLV